MTNLEKQIKRVFEQYESAVLAKNVEAFMGLYVQDVRVFDTWGAWSYDGAPAWRQAVHQWFVSLGDETVRVKFEDVQADGGQDLTLVSAIVSYASISAEGTELRSMQNRLTWALTRREGALKIVHEHTSAPVGFDDLKAILRRETGR